MVAVRAFWGCCTVWYQQWSALGLPTPEIIGTSYTETEAAVCCAAWLNRDGRHGAVEIAESDGGVLVHESQTSLQGGTPDVTRVHQNFS